MESVHLITPVGVEIATAAHAGIFDKSGVPYVEHPLTVARFVLEGGGDRHQVEAAVLHDVVEDTAFSLHDLFVVGFSARTLSIVDALTKRKGESLEESMLRVSITPGAPDVKRADVKHNTLPERVKHLPQEVRSRLDIKYTKTLRLLDEYGSLLSL